MVVKLSVKAVLMCRSRLIAQVWVFDCMVNILVTTFVMSMIGVVASLLAVYAAALFAERDFSLAFVNVG